MAARVRVPRERDGFRTSQGASWRADLRTEAELSWYWLRSADEEQSSVRARTYEAIYLGQLAHRPALIRTSGSGGITIDAGLRCGPVYVPKPAPPYREPVMEPDQRSLSAMRLRRRIRQALERLQRDQRLRLGLAFGQRPEVLRVQGWPVPLLAVLPVTSALHLASGSHARLHSWLLRLEDGADARDLALAAEAQLARDAKAYVAARTGR